MTNKKGKIFMSIGIIFIFISLGFTVFNIALQKKADSLSKNVVETLKTNVIPSESLDTFEDDEQSVTIDGNIYIGIIDIPSLDISLPVMGEFTYEGLKYSPCRYKGSFDDDNVIISAHNYKNQFGKLEDITGGEIVTFTDVNGNVYKYKTTQFEVIKGYDVEAMDYGDWDLTLFTCDYSGRNRITIRCERTYEDCYAFYNDL